MLGRLNGGRSYTDKNGKYHTPVIARFTSWYARNCLYEVRKDSRLYIKADLTARRQDLLAWALRRLEDEKRVANVCKYIFADRNCHLTIHTHDGRYLRFNSNDEFDRLLNYIEDSLPPMRAAFLEVEISRKMAGAENFLVNLSEVDISDWIKDPKNYYIGRDHGSVEGSMFQNPFSLNDFDRKTAIGKYRSHIMSSPNLLQKVHSELDDKILGCFCLPEECHGQVLLDILNK